MRNEANKWFVFKGALSAWSQLLKSNPKLEPAKKAQVEKVMAEVRQANDAN